MNDQITRPENTEPVTPATPSRKTSVADIFARISIAQLTLAVLVGIFLWQWLDGHRAINDMRQQLAEKITEMDGGNKANQILLKQSQDQVRDLSAKVLTLETRYAAAQNQYAALETLYSDLSVSRDETALAEVEQMLLIAEQQLQLSANVKAALITLQSADARLQRINRPAFSGLRKAIIQDLDKLRALPSVDITGINFQLNVLIAAVDSMPLAYQQRTAKEVIAQTVAPEDETAWQKLSREIWQEMRQLVRIENTEKDSIPLLLPTQEFFLRENLKLRLLAARLALLSRDEISYTQELKTALLWATRYFDEKSNQGVQMLTSLKNLSAYDISIQLPDINPSLQAARNFHLTREKAAR